MELFTNGYVKQFTPLPRGTIPSVTKSDEVLKLTEITSKKNFTEENFANQ